MQSIKRWILTNQLKNEKGLALEFVDHRFLIDIYEDFTPEQVVLKAAQIGLSTLQIIKTIYVAKFKKMDIIYTLPTDNDVSVFVGGKVNRIIRQNPVLQTYTADKDTVEQKKIDESMTYWRGTFTKRAAISVSADLLEHDEVDFSNQEIIGDYESRLQHSKYKWRWYFGHPSVPGIGVSKYWEDSDQKHWFVECRKCLRSQFLNFPESICIDRKIFQCKYCKAEIDDNQRVMGRWVAKYKDKKFSGYWIPLLIAPWITAEKILEYHETKTPEYFTNRVLGLPYVGGGNKVTQETILGNLTQDFNEQKGNIVIGVDTGCFLRYVVGNKRGIFHYGETKKYSDIEALLMRFPNSIAVFDQGGDIIGVREMRAKYPGRVYLCHYRQDKKTMQLVTWGDKDEQGNVIVDRNRMMQFIIEEFKDRRIPLNGTKEEWWEYWKHWDSIYRVQEEDALGVIKSTWMRNGRDDWVHATVYWRTGMSRYGNAEGYILSGEVERINRSPVINPDQTITFNPLIPDKIDIDVGGSDGWIIT